MGPYGCVRAKPRTAQIPDRVLEQKERRTTKERNLQEDQGAALGYVKGFRGSWLGFVPSDSLAITYVTNVVGSVNFIGFMLILC